MSRNQPGGDVSMAKIPAKAKTLVRPPKHKKQTYKAFNGTVFEKIEDIAGYQGKFPILLVSYPAGVSTYIPQIKGVDDVSKYRTLIDAALATHKKLTIKGSLKKISVRAFTSISSPGISRTFVCRFLIKLSQSARILGLMDPVS